MGARTSARESALQMLFAVDAGGVTADQAIADYWGEFPGNVEGRAYADRIVREVAGRLPDLDELVGRASKNWRLERMTRVDRTVLRLGAWELAHNPEVPRPVIIDEAVEMAKRFGSAESGKFVNGILDRIADDCARSE